MKVTSLKDMDNYIYSTVVLPLKELDVDGLSSVSPITDDNGRQAQFHVGNEDIHNVRYAHNFQREEAQRSTLRLVFLKYNRTTIIVADYNPKKHNVNIYTPQLETIEGGKLILNKLIHAFENHTPFTRVELQSSVRDQWASPLEGFEVSDDREDEDEEEWDD
jgi:hypothetical protein